ncbi:MAG: hypothetical protein HQ472_03465 [Ignavibacteria bacterium]|nr:hypothetical protein [Ignavibacteria bacterium]
MRVLLLFTFFTTFLLIPSHCAKAQTEASDFSRIGHAAFFTANVTDYQCVGINPANLGFEPTKDIYRLSTPVLWGIERSRRPLAFTFAEGGASIHSDALPKSGLVDMLLQTNSIKFTNADKIEAAKAFADKGIRFSFDVITAAVSYQTDDFGGLALTVRERISGSFRFNESASNLAFQGRHFDYFDSLALDWKGDTVGFATQPQKFSELFDGTRLSMLWFREVGLSYGVTVIESDDFSIQVGATGKYLMGYAYLDAYTSEKALVAKSALSPVFGISYGTATTPSFIPGTDFQSVGSGFGFDLGVTVSLENWAFSASVIDMGAIHWTGNVFLAKDTILNGLSSTGFDSYNIFVEAPKITGDGNYFKWDGLQTATSELPTRIRMGTAYRYSSKWKFGADAVIPLNSSSGALGQAIVTAGAEYRPLKWLTIGSGIGGGGNMGMFMPLSIGFSILDGIWEMGISSRDILLFVTDTQPVLGFTLGFMRFRF